ncbi:VOC family protein [Halobellus rubicundus]|uniref:VOC family protein n=1 Tax=Halobellus rubicundus TaxID=2996466 RepID=A0ABD5MG82_9EURY
MTADAPDTPLPDETRLGRVALRVEDLDEMTAFYRRVVGLDVLERSDAAATLGAGDDPVLRLVRDAAAAPRDRSQAGLFHSAFRVPSRTALGAALERVRERWTLSGASDHDVSEALYLSDPEDNGVEIYRDRPREAWPRSADGTAEMGTYPLDLESLAEASDGAADAPTGTDLGHVHLEATSLPDARSFYVDALGFGVQVEDRGALFLAAGDYHHHVGVNTWNRRTSPAGGRGLSWFEIVVPDTETLVAVRDRLADAGVESREIDRGIEVRDPDDVAVRLRAE